MKSSKLILAMLASSIVGGASVVGIQKLMNKEVSPQKIEVSPSKNNEVARTVAYNPSQEVLKEANFLVPASTIATPAVVHIKTYYSRQIRRRSGFDDLLDEYYKGRRRPQLEDQNMQLASGSGVIISEDGYIVTNHHVIESAEKIEVVLNDKRSFTATKIGIDPTTDLAVLKIEDEKAFPYLKYGDSDALKIGEWVLAVGNPFDLTSTVTAGIVSAKSRSINLLRSKAYYAIESFIQTDAAVNPGNSGGALVDLEGNLIGVNTAIASRTGSYAGYSFAVPVTLVKKVVNDLIEYGEVHRALMGVSIVEVTAEVAKELNLEQVGGVYIQAVVEGGGAAEAGLKAGDIIIEIDGHKVKNSPELQELIARHQPGEKAKVKYYRDGKLEEIEVVLQGAKEN